MWWKYNNGLNKCSSSESYQLKQWQSEWATTHLTDVACTRSIAVPFVLGSILHTVIGVSTETVVIILKENSRILLCCFAYKTKIQVHSQYSDKWQFICICIKVPLVTVLHLPTRWKCCFFVCVCCCFFVSIVFFLLFFA